MKSMVRWYDPPALAYTASRVIISNIFGEFADPRQAQAASRPFDPDEFDPIYRYAADGDFWFDFVADLGDGWNSTAAIAHALGQDRIEIGGEAYPRGRFLIMGGDQVYPQASRDEYRARLIAPYECALPEGSVDPEPHLYAIPGNHDWYDGLNAFLGLFCSRRTASSGTIEPGRLIGAWRTQQTRSYFALQLPAGWWVWGVDTQLNGYIDRAQLDYFGCVAEKFMDPSQRVILVGPESNWLEVATKGPKVWRNLVFMKKFIEARGHSLRLVMAGNLHHFTCYQGDGVIWVGSGGGGAFCDATHKYGETLTVSAPAAMDQRDIELVRLGEAFPSPQASFNASLRALLFPVFNPVMTACLAAIWIAFAWALDIAARTGGGRLAGGLSMPLFDLYRSPLAIFMILLTFAGTVGFADGLGARRWLLGLGHGLAQVMLMLAVPAIAAAYVDSTILLFLVVGVAGGVASAFVFGAYLWLALTAMGLHNSHTFSSFRLQDFKHFVRARIGPDGKLWLYPIGLTHVPRRWRFEQTGSGAWRAQPEPPLAPQLLSPIGPIE